MHGFLNVYKPKGVTSHDVVHEVRKKLGTKVGHLGTLDPMAEGVLPLVLGAAARLIEFLPPQHKTYLAEITLGIHTDTLDIEGKILKTDAPEFIEEKILEEAIKSFTGVITQFPPKYSAVKIKGKKAYELARKGIEFELKPREVEIFSAHLISYDFPKFTARFQTSAGTYIRSLCVDLGKKLGQMSVLSALTRERSGAFFIKDGIRPEELKKMAPDELEKNIIPLAVLFPSFQNLMVNKIVENKILNGAVLDIKYFEGKSEKLNNKDKVLVYSIEGILLAVGEVVIEKNIKIKPLKVLGLA